MTIAINEHLDLLGKKVSDKVTKFQGVVTSVTFDLYGCIQALVHPGLKSDGTALDQLWFDVARLEVIDPIPVMQRPQYEWHKDPQAIAEGRQGAADRPPLGKV